MNSVVGKPKCFYCGHRDAVHYIITGINIISFKDSTYKPVCHYCDTPIYLNIARYITANSKNIDSDFKLVTKEL